MTNYRQRLNTKEEAEAWFEKHPNGVLRNCQGVVCAKYKFNGFASPYTVEKTGNTITRNGVVYTEGDIADDWLKPFAGCVVEIVKGRSVAYNLKILHIPDEVADKPAPKEPKTLTLEEVIESDVWIIHPLTKELMCIYPKPVNHYYALKAHVADGHNLYPTCEDAELGKARGMS